MNKIISDESTWLTKLIDYLKGTNIDLHYGETEGGKEVNAKIEKEGKIKNITIKCEESDEQSGED